MSKFWLIKSEPSEFSIEDLEKSKNKTTYWYGVRNYQARNFIRDEMKLLDKVLFYHSNTEPNAIVGVCEVVKEAYPDHTQFDPKHIHYDPKADKKNPQWFMVDIKFVNKFKNVVLPSPDFPMTQIFPPPLITKLGILIFFSVPEC